MPFTNLIIQNLLRILVMLKASENSGQQTYKIKITSLLLIKRGKIVAFHRSHKLTNKNRGTTDNFYQNKVDSSWDIITVR